MCIRDSKVAVVTVVLSGSFGVQWLLCCASVQCCMCRRLTPTPPSKRYGLAVARTRAVVWQVDIYQTGVSGSADRLPHLYWFFYWFTTSVCWGEKYTGIIGLSNCTCTPRFNFRHFVVWKQQSISQSIMTGNLAIRSIWCAVAPSINCPTTQQQCCLLTDSITGYWLCTFTTM